MPHSCRVEATLRIEPLYQVSIIEVQASSCARPAHKLSPIYTIRSAGELLVTCICALCVTKGQGTHSSFAQALKMYPKATNILVGKTSESEAGRSFDLEVLRRPVG
jgi:hypothetical protein